MRMRMRRMRRRRRRRRRVDNAHRLQTRLTTMNTGLSLLNSPPVSLSLCLHFSTSSVALAERFATLNKETLTFQTLLAKRAIKALGVVVVVKGLHPTVPCLNGKPARDAFGGE